MIIEVLARIRTPMLRANPPSILTSTLIAELEDIPREKRLKEQENKFLTMPA